MRCDMKNSASMSPKLGQMQSASHGAEITQYTHLHNDVAVVGKRNYAHSTWAKGGGFAAPIY